MALRLNGATAGYVELNAPDSAASNTLTLPNGNGSSGQYLQTNGSGALSWQTVVAENTQSLTETHVNAPNTTAATWTDLPANIQWITCGWNEASSSTQNSQNERLIVQVGTGATPT